MTQSTKKKHVVNEILSWSDDRLPAENERIVRVICGRGNNLHEVEEIGKQDDKFLVSMPGKFRKTVWVKRGDSLIVTDIPEGDKVKAEISEILSKKRIQYLKKMGVWPEKDESHIPQDEEMFENLNRRAHSESDESSSSESS